MKHQTGPAAGSDGGRDARRRATEINTDITDQVAQEKIQVEATLSERQAVKRW